MDGWIETFTGNRSRTNEWCGGEIVREGVSTGSLGLRCPITCVDILFLDKTLGDRSAYDQNSLIPCFVILISCYRDLFPKFPK